jgi:hypothetical protein
MLKVLGIRSLVALVAVLVVAAAIYGMQDRFLAWWAAGQGRLTVGEDSGDWRQRELVFLKQIYDRLESQRQAAADNVPMSLRREQETILRRMEETANPIRDKIPPEVRALLPGGQAPAQPEKPAPEVAAQVAAPAPQIAAPAAPQVAVQVAPSVAPAPTSEPIELRVGAVAFPAIDTDLNSLARDPELDRALERVNKLRARPAKPAEPAAKPATAETSGSAKE